MIQKVIMLNDNFCKHFLKIDMAKKLNFTNECFVLDSCKQTSKFGTEMKSKALFFILKRFFDTGFVLK